MKPSTPNLLFILTDEQRFDTLWSDDVSMPCLNRFSEQSCYFEEAYCTHPLCTPSRGSLLTGLYSHAHGALGNNMLLPEDMRCLPELLTPEQRKTYRTAYHGKWHLGDEIFAQHGFDEWISYEDNYDNFYRAGRNRNSKSTYNGWLRKSGFKPDFGESFTRDRVCCLPEQFGKPSYITEESCRFLNNIGSNPFVLFVNYLEPHMPFFGPRSGEYNPATLKLPDNFGPRSGDSLLVKITAERHRRAGFDWYDLTSEAGWRQMTAAYRGLCSLVDTMVGRILATLEANGLADNTIVVFTSDHGEMMGSHGMLGKRVMHQESVRVPLLIRLPGQQKMQRITGPFSQIDLLPTLLDLMGTPTVPELHGKSHASILGEDDTRLSDDVVIAWNDHPDKRDQLAAKPIEDWQLELAGSRERYLNAMTDPARTIVSADGWKFVTSPFLGEPQLFDLNQDPLELKNLANDPKYNHQIHHLKGRLKKWQLSTKDTVPIE